MHTFSALVIDDERPIRELIGDLLRREGIRVLAADNPHDGLKYVQYDSVDVVLTDMRLPGECGLEVITRCRQLRPELPIVLITGYASVETAVEAMRLGACDYVSKPLTRQRLLDALEHARRASQQCSTSKNAVSREVLSCCDPAIIAQSPALCEILKVVARIAPTKATVLIEGETGVGKEVIAQRIHSLSDRRAGPFVRVNCGAIPESLFESELFGHERGAFTGAEQRRAGCFEMAHGGTVFLDEVGEMPRRVQVRLLHALQDGRFRRVGGTELLDVDMRVIAATNRDLEADVQQGRFRKDLYFRLNVVSLRIPPLRERIEDITALAHSFAKRLVTVHGKPNVTLSDELLERLVAYDWPGNVRELSNALERMVILFDGKQLEPRHLPDNVRKAQRASSGEMVAVPISGNLEDIERHLIEEMIDRCHGNKAEAARRLGMNRRTLYRVMERGLSAAQPSASGDQAEATPNGLECLQASTSPVSAAAS